jgi:uncharacterized protein YggE
MDTLHLISVQETATATLHASGAQLNICIKGQSFFTGGEAFKKAIEVAHCITELKQCGLSEDDIQLLNVSTEVESGMLSKSSKANYHLLVNCEAIELLGCILSAIASQKNAKMTAILWKYSNLDEIKTNLLQLAVANTKNVAQSIANSLAVTLIGVHKLSYKVSGLDTEMRIPEESNDFMDTMTMRRSRSEALDNLNFAHTAKAVLTVTADFMVDTFNQSSN